MRAAVFREPGRIELEDRPVPEIGADELLVRVRAASVCGTDLRIAAHGHFRLPPGTPRVLGHEVAGEVVEACAATGFAVGQRISVTPNVGCGRCVPRRYAHRSINTGTEPLITFFAFPGHAGHDYGTIEQKGFRKLCVERDSAPSFVDNPRWVEPALPAGVDGASR